MTKIVSIDGTSLNDSTFRSFFIQSYGGGGQKATYVGQADGRPALSALSIEPRYLPPLQVVIEGANAATARRTLHKLFFQEDETKKTLIVADDDGSNQRYWYAVVEAFDQVPNSGGLSFVATMRAVDDNALRGTTPVEQGTTITTTPTNLGVNNPGDIRAHPIISLTPTTAKSGTWQYRRFVRLRWQSPEAASRYPVDVLNGMDTTGLVTAGKMQADGRDLRVLVNGVMVEPYISGPNTSTTRAWVALDFAPYDNLRLATAIAGSGTVSTIDVKDDITAYPNQGLLVIDNEIFAYTSRNTVLKQFAGVTRAERGSSMAAHSVDATVWLCQHDLWVLYGHSGTLPPLAPSEIHRPAFDLAASSNTAWTYGDGNFGDNVGYRPAQWRFNRISGASGNLYPYTEETAADIDPWQVIGVAAHMDGNAEWRLSVPSGVSAMTISGQKYRSLSGLPWDAWVTMTHRNNFGLVADKFTPISAPSSLLTWQPWSASPTSPSVAKTEVGFRLSLTGAINPYVEWNAVHAASAVITLFYPVLHTMTPEREMYSLDARIRNLTTGDIIALRFDMDLGDTLVIDTETRQVTLASGNSAFSALSMQGPKRSGWLPLEPGSNTLRYEESGVTGVDWDVEFAPRYIF